MIEIQAKLLRGPVYFVQETIQCLITLKNIPRSSNNDHQNGLISNGDISNNTNNNNSGQKNKSIERICWANVQLHCFCTVDETQIDCRRIIEENLDNQLINHNGNYINNKNKRHSIAFETYSSNDTSFHESLIRGERGIIVFASKPKILFCDLQLEPYQCQTFIYTETLPSNLNPSYSSTRLKYYYKLSIGAQRIGSPIYLLKIPIRLLIIDGFSSTPLTSNNIDNHQTPNGDTDRNNSNNEDDDNKSYTSSITYDDETKDYGSILDISLHHIEYLAGHRIPHNFNITSSHGKVAKFLIFKTIYRLGEDIIGLFDFTDCTVKCIRYSVVLQSLESIDENYLLKSSSSTTTKNESNTIVTNHTRFHECCLNMLHSPMILTIPFTLTPTFSNSLIQHKWNLHFSFVIENDNVQKTTIIDQQPQTINDDDNGIQTLTKRRLNVQIMTWDFPIKIIATYPAHVAKGFQMASIGTLNI